MNYENEEYGIAMEVTRQMTIATRQEEQEWMTLSKKYKRERERERQALQQQIDRAALLPSVPPPRIIHMIITRIRVREAYCCATKKPQPFTSGASPGLSKYSFFPLFLISLNIIIIQSVQR